MRDVVVVGGSLAGASTAIQLARRGVSVELIERSAGPRRKACGEGLFSRGAEVLEELAVLDQVLKQGRVLESLRVEIGDASVEAPLPSEKQPCIGARREVLDSALLDQAALCGVEVRRGVNATDLLSGGRGYRGVLTDLGEVEARVVVVADGLRSRLRRVAELDAPVKTQRYGVSARYELSMPVEPRVLIRMQPGREIYVTPVGERTVNVALLTSKRGAAELSGDLARAFEAAVREDGAVSADARLVEQPIAAGPFPAMAKRAWRDNLLLAGDAAGFFDGISGEGMSLALVSSKAAAEAVMRFLETDDSAGFGEYERERRRLERNSTMLARISLLLASHPALGRRAIANLGKHPSTFEKVLAINAGGSGLSGLRPRDFRHLLLGA